MTLREPSKNTSHSWQLLPGNFADKSVSRKFKIAFTGNRSNDSPGRSVADLEAIRPLIRAELESHQPLGPILCYSAAEGADLIACEEALACGIPLEIHLPLTIDEFRDDFADRMEAWPRAREIIHRTMAPRHSLRILEGGLTRPACYAAVNELLLHEANLLIAVTVDSPQKPGGASEMVRLARHQKIPCIIINPLKRKTIKG